MHVPRQRCDRREDDDGDEQCDGGRRLRVARPREQHVPERVDERRGERERESEGRHGDRVGSSPDWPENEPLVIAHRGASSGAAREHAAGVRARDRASELTTSSSTCIARRGRLRARRHARRRPAGAHAPDPTLEEVLELCRGRIGVMAELKSARPLPAARHRPRGRSACSTTSGRRLLRAAPRSGGARLRPELRTVQHVGFGVSIRRCRSAPGRSGFHERSASPRADSRRRGGSVSQTTVYTVNDAARMLRARRARRDGIFTDRPDLALRSSCGRRPLRESAPTRRPPG